MNPAPSSMAGPMTLWWIAGAVVMVLLIPAVIKEAKSTGLRKLLLFLAFAAAFFAGLYLYTST